MILFDNEHRRRSIIYRRVILYGVGGVVYELHTVCAYIREGNVNSIFPLLYRSKKHFVLVELRLHIFTHSGVYYLADNLYLAYPHFGTVPTRKI